MLVCFFVCPTWLCGGEGGGGGGGRVGRGLRLNSLTVLINMYMYMISCRSVSPLQELCT